MSHDLTDEQLHDAAAGDLNVLAILMLVGSIGFSIINMVVGTMGWIAAALVVWSIGLLRRNPTIAAFVKIGFGFSGLAAPVVGIVGILLAVFGDYSWGWAVLGAAVVYFFFSLLGLEIIERAQTTGVIESWEL
jgi:hypothetical protein